MASGSCGQPAITPLLLGTGADVAHTATGKVTARSTGAAMPCADTASDDIVLTMARTAAHDECTALLLAAAEPWSPSTHKVLAEPQRRRAVELLQLGALLARNGGTINSGEALGSGFLNA